MQLPSLTLGGPYSTDENMSITFVGFATDAGTLDTHIFEWDLDYDGLVFDPDATGESVTHTWDDDYTGYLALRVTDNDGDSHVDVVSVAVANTAPTANIGGAYAVFEGETVQLDAGGSTDPGNDSLSYSWDTDNDGEFDDATGVNPVFSAVGLDGPTTVTIGLQVTDDDGASDTATVEISVDNEVPTAQAGGPYTVVEGGIITLDGSGSDPAGVLDPLTFSWDFDGDGEYDDGDGVSPDFSALGLDGPMDVTVWLRVTDDDGGVDTVSVVIGITNAAPVADAGGPYTVAEGSSISLDASGSTDLGGDTLTYAWDFDGDGEYDDASGVNPIFSAVGLDGPNDGNGGSTGDR